ncbi:MAG TPA: PIN domain-containing protein [Acidimicrobiia bacterium]|nr:PIN domain-containing protein [Acidimicrobiia bacterium]
MFDASALLAFLEGEEGADEVEDALLDGGVVGAANWSEVGQKVLQHRRDWDRVRALLLSYRLVVEPVTMEDAEGAAVGWRKGSGLSLADRLCLALGDRLEAIVWTADTHWGSDSPVRQIR